MDNATVDTSEKFLEGLGCGLMTEERQKLLEEIRIDGWRSYGMASKNKGFQHFKAFLRDLKGTGIFFAYGTPHNFQRKDGY